MRNLFDQYSQPENQVTHALVSALAEDSRLLRRFVRWVSPRRRLPVHGLRVVEQSLPGETPVTEKEAERRGLPDACIYQGDQFALLIESKIAAAVSHDQLRRHQRTAERRGFRDIAMLVIAVQRPSGSWPASVLIRTWSEIYAWLVQEARRSRWARRVADYLVVAEGRLPEDYPLEGTLTTFTGIPFGADEPYNYPEAKRLLKLATQALRAQPRLVHDLGMDPAGAGRGAITGRDGAAVWDFLRIKGLERGGTFTSSPHLTLAIEADRVVATITVPNGIQRAFRQNLLKPGFDTFVDLFAKMNTRLQRALRDAPGAAPWVILVQRRYPSQRAMPLIDANIEYDLRTAFPGKRRGLPVKPQPQWLQATYEALTQKRSNLQIAVGAAFPYRTCSATKDPAIVEHVAQAWLACQPLLDMLHGRT